MSSERLKLLTDINFVWDFVEEEWLKNFNFLKESYQILPREEKRKLNHWITRQRWLYNKGKLDKEKVVLLSTIGFDWKPQQSFFQLQVKYLDEYRKVHDGNWPKKHEEYPDGNKLGQWLNRIRQEIKKNKLSPEKLAYFHTDNFVVDVKQKLWDDRFEELVSFRHLFPDRWPMTSEKYGKNFKLGYWCAQQRQLFAKGGIVNQRHQ